MNILEFHALQTVQNIQFDQQILEDFQKASCWFHFNDEF